MQTRDRIVSALTQYDARLSKRRGWNPYGLGIMFEALDRAEAMVKEGKTWDDALSACFCDRLLDVVLRAAR